MLIAMLRDHPLAQTPHAKQLATSSVASIIAIGNPSDAAEVAPRMVLGALGGDPAACLGAAGMLAELLRADMPVFACCGLYVAGFSPARP